MSYTCQTIAPARVLHPRGSNPPHPPPLPNTCRRSHPPSGPVSGRTIHLMSRRKSSDTSTPSAKRPRASSPFRSPAVAAGAAMAADHGTFKLNATYFAELDIAWRKVCQHPVFQGLPKMKSQPIGMEGLDIIKFKSNIAQHGTHTCGGNLFWADVFFTATPGVPINRRGVHCLTFHL